MIPALLDDLDCRHIVGTRTWIVDADFRFRSAVLGAIVTVPSGFLTDFNSIPRGLWNLLPPDENPEAGVGHDFLYRCGGFTVPYDDGAMEWRAVTRAAADAVHREILEMVDAEEPGAAPRWKRQAMYLGLRIGGWWTWRTYRRAETAEDVGA